MSKANLFTFTQEQREAIASLLRKEPPRSRLYLRASIISRLMAGQSAYRIAMDTRIRFNTVYKWQKRFLSGGVPALKDAPRSGQPRRITEDETSRVLEMTLHTIPPGSFTHWSIRLMSFHADVPRYRVAAIWKAANLKPHLVSTFNFSNDPDFAEKVIDIVGFYMNPPVDAIVLAVDEKAQIQALDHTQPLLQFRPGQIERHTYDDAGNRTTNLYDVFDTMTGKNIGNTTSRHHATEFISFLDLIDRRMLAHSGRDHIHIILDNRSIHEAKEVADWQWKHPRYTFHFTPTSSSWLDAVESWFSRLEHFGLRGKTFESVKQLREHIRQHIDQFNRYSAKPLVWIKDAD